MQSKNDPAVAGAAAHPCRSLSPETLLLAYRTRAFWDRLCGRAGACASRFATS